jgi:hypothetical protein
MMLVNVEHIPVVQDCTCMLGMSPQRASVTSHTTSLASQGACARCCTTAAAAPSASTAPAADERQPGG